MASNWELKRQIRQELMDLVAKYHAQIKEHETTASNERFLSTTVRGGLIAAAAESACLDRARAADGRANDLKRKIKWHEEMLAKYR